MLMQKTDSKFRKLILHNCYDALEEMGFVKYKRDEVDRPITLNFHCWVGLNTGLYRDRLEISPFVGIHAVSIAKMGAFGIRKYDRSVATYAIAMGELEEARDERAFIFSPTQSDSFIASEILRLARIYATIGLHYAASISNYDALLPLLESRVAWLGGYPERVACCLFLMGRIQEARTFVEDFTMKEPSYFGEFAAHFRRVIESGRAG
jgi:hypothetical protein